MSSKPEGLYPKYRAIRIDSPNYRHANATDPIKISGFPMEEVLEPFFLLKLSDPHAEVAIKAYANSCEETHPQLATDLRAWFGE